MKGKRFPGAYDSKGVWHSEAQPYAHSEGIGLRTAYARAERGDMQPSKAGPKAKPASLSYEGGVYSTVREIAEKTGHHESTIRRRLKRAQEKKRRDGAVPPLPSAPSGADNS